MIFAGERCLKLHRIIFMAIGLWPYKKSFIWRIQAIFVFALYFCLLSSQFLTFVTTTCNMDCILKRLSYICISFVYILSYCCFYFNSEIIKEMLEHIQLDWKMFEKCNAMKILEEYLFESYVLIVFANICIIICTPALTTYKCLPIILDAIRPTNVSRPRKIEMDLELFVNEEQHFFLYLIQEILGLVVGVQSIIATGTFFNTVLKHCCAIYKIASCLIRNTVTVRTLQIPAPQRMQFMYRSIRFSVHIHRRTLEFSRGFFLSLDLWFFPIVIFGVLALSCLLFRLYNALMVFDDFYDILVTCLILNFCLMYMFIANFIAQSYTEHSIKLVESIHDTLWYVAPLPIQKLFLMMQKSIKSHKIVGGGLFVASIEGFSTLITSSVSYFTVLHAMRPQA